MSRLVRLYPRAWRTRYEAEFTEVLSARPLGLVDRVDIIRAALDAHLHPEVLTPERADPPAPASAGDLRVSRPLGIGALVGTALWIAAWAVYAMGPVRYDPDGAYRDGAAAAPFLLGAVALFAGGLAGQLVRLPRSAPLARAGAAVAIPFTLLWGLAPWLVWLAAPMVGGLALLAVGAHRSAGWPALSSVAVLLACVAAVVPFAYGMSADVDRMTGGVLFILAATAFSPAWLVVGGSLIRRPA